MVGIETQRLDRHGQQDEVRTLADIEQTVVAARGTRPIVIGDLATVRVGEALKRGEGSYNGQPAVVLGIQRQPDVNTLQLTRTLDRAFDEIQATLPEGATQTHISLFDGSNCGISLAGKPVFSVQYHPEASPGPRDSHYLFTRFVNLMRANKGLPATKER